MISCKRPDRFALAASILTYLSGCGPAADGSAPEEDLVFGSSDVHILGTSDQIATVLDLEVLSDGTIWVLNSIEPFFVAFGGDGLILSSHGRIGGGPDEFQGPGGFVARNIDDDVWAFDWARHGFFRISRPDEAILAQPIPPDRVPPGSVIEGMNMLGFYRLRTARLGGEIILPRARIDGEMQASRYWYYAWNPDLVALDPSTDSVRTVVALTEVLGDPTPHIPVTDYPPFPLWYRLWGVCGEDELRVYDRIGNQVRRFDGRGVELDPTPLPPPRFTEVTVEQFAHATLELAAVELMGEVPLGPLLLSPEDSAYIYNALLRRITLEPAQMVSLLPRYVDFRCDDAGTLWVQPLDLEVGRLRGGPLWLRITSDGQVREVWLPDRFDPLRFTTDKIWGVQRDELNVASVGWIDLPSGW